MVPYAINICKTPIMKYNYNWAGKKILIVEDDQSSYVYMSELFKHYNAGISRNINGLDAFFFCMNHNPDVVIMDLLIQGLNGYDATTLIKKFNPSIPVIVVTACAMKEERLKSREAGCDIFLTKPILPADILPVVDHFLSEKVGIAGKQVVQL